MSVEACRTIKHEREVEERMKYGDGRLKGRKRLFVHAIKESAQGSVAAKLSDVQEKLPSNPASFSQVPRSSQREETREYVPAIAGSRSQGQARTLVASN